MSRKKNYSKRKKHKHSVKRKPVRTKRRTKRGTRKTRGTKGGGVKSSLKRMRGKLLRGHDRASDTAGKYIFDPVLSRFGKYTEDDDVDKFRRFDNKLNSALDKIASQPHPSHVLAAKEALEHILELGKLKNKTTRKTYEDLSSALDDKNNSRF